eukprot:c13677_g1_i2.p1 GENE.c13677_g1_i2~~c13677_g1_i2.p1  ORF type:complete len:289 (-),score=66.47 c13677_g1_i2:21-887(-)
MEGRRCLVVGVLNARSIAWAVASNWAKNGAKVTMTCESERNRGRLENMISEHGWTDRMWATVCDVRDESKVKQSVDLAANVHGLGEGLDCVVHSVAYASPAAMKSSVLMASQADFSDAIHVSAFSLISLARAARPWMLPAKQLREDVSPSITCLSFLGSQRVVPEYSIMGPCKATLEAISRNLAVELGEDGIRCNVLSPGPINTTAARGIRGFGSLAKKFNSDAPLKRHNTSDAKLEQCANAATFLAINSGITGQVLLVDHGRSLVLGAPNDSNDNNLSNSKSGNLES